MASVSEGVSNFFTASIQNTSTTADANVAVFPGHYPILGLTRTPATGAITELLVNYSDVTEIQKAKPSVDTILDDRTIAFGGGQLIMVADDPSKSIRAFRKYIETNARELVSMTMFSDKVQAYQFKLLLQKTNPFTDPETIPVELNKFFSTQQYQTNKIDIDFSSYQLEVSDVLFMQIQVPRDSTIGLTLRFAPLV